MARDHGPLTPEDEQPVLDEFDGRMLELDPEEESPFLRGQKRVPVRRGSLPRKTAHRLKYVVLGVIAVGAVSVVAAGLYRYGVHSWRFRLDSSDQIEIAGVENVSRGQVREVFGEDIGRNLFSIPLEERKQQLEEIPWVESAAVMRLLPNRLKVEIRERTPVAFVQIGSRVALMDRAGAVMDLPAGGAKQYSFPVIVGVGEQEPLSTRAARMKIYHTVIRELDSDGAQYSRDISEVDLSDPEDVKINVADPGGPVLVHLGSTRFLDRYRIFIANVQKWRQQVPRLDSVDLRYDRQVIVNPDSAVHPTSSPVTAQKPAPARRTVVRKPGPAAHKKAPPKKKTYNRRPPPR